VKYLESRQNCNNYYDSK